jgi:hypothetical protein
MKASCVTLNYFLFILLISTGIVNAQTVTGTVFKDPQGNWSIQSNGENLEIREPENGNKIWAKFHDDSYFQLIGTPNFIADGYIQAGGNITLDGTHMIFRNSSGNGVIDYGNGSSGKLYFRRLSSAGNTSSYADRMILSNEGFLSIGAIHASTPLHIYNSNNTLVTYQTSDGGPFYHEWKTSNTNILARQGFINDLNHYEIDLNGTGGKLFKITTDYGDVRLGARNGEWAHFYTSMPKYYFDKEIWVNSGKIGSYDENLSLQVRGTTRMTLTEEGNVGIGTNAPQHELDVKGVIRAEELVVEMDGADFVFESDYKLKSLEEVEAFIKANGHLPDVASAADMQINGVKQSEMNQKLLQKIEELTLYIIEQNSEIKDLKKQIGR